MVGVQVAVIRNFQLVNTKDKKGQVKPCFKALEAVVQLKDKNGNLKSISSKCADTNVTVAALLGVPPAVLENVIFCHQDEGLWPLSDMTTLKKKFDDLFGSSRFTKALDTINGLRKNHAKVVKEKKHQMDLLTKDVHELRDIDGKLADCEQQGNMLQEDIRRLEVEAAEAEKLQQDLNEEFQPLAHFNVESSNLKAQMEGIDRRIAALISELEEVYDDPYDQQLHVQALLEDQAQEDTKEALQTRGQLEEAEKRVENCQKALNDVHAESSALHRAEQRMESVTARLSALDRKLQDLIVADTTGVLAPFKSFSVTEPKTLGSLLSALSEALRLSKSNHEHKVREDLSVLQDSLLKVNSSVEGQRTHVSSLKSEAARMEGNITVLGDRASRIDALQSEIRGLEAQESSLKKSLEQHASIQDLECSVTAANEKRDQLHEESLAIQDQLALAQELHRQSENLRLEKSRLSDAQMQIDTHEKSLQRGAVFRDLERTVGTFNPILWMPHVERLHRTKVDELRKLEDNLREAQADHTTANGQVGMLHERQLQAEAEIEDIRSKLAKVLGLEPSAETFPSLVTALEADTEDALREITIVTSAEDMYRNYFDHSLKKSKCAFCNRSFKDQSEIRSFEQYMKQRIVKLPAQKREAEALYNEKADALKQLRDITSDFDRYLYLSTHEKVELEAKLKVARKEAEDSEEELRSQAALVESVKEDLDQVKTILSVVKSTKSLYEILETTTERIARLEVPKKRSAGSMREPTMRTMDDLQESNKCLLMEIQKITSDIQTFNKTLESVRKITQQLKNTQSQLERLRDEIEQLRSQRREMQTISENLKKTNHAIEVASKELTSLTNERTEISNRLEKKKSELLETERRFLEQSTFVQSLSGEIESAHAEITEAQKQIEHASSSKDRLQRARKVLQEAKDGLAAARSADEAVKVRIEERIHLQSLLSKNLQVAEMRKARTDLEKKLQELLSKSDASNVEELKKRLSSQVDKVNSLRQQIAHKVGEKKAIMDWRQRLHDDSCHVKFKDLQMRFSNMEIEYVTTELTVQDLKRYYTALDRALMVYHNEKMKEINLCIRQLWQQIYKGSDIDSIAIRSSVSDEDTTTVGSGSRSYNYRIVMVKGDVELEMKGRCSAGQKVLACLVIRLALAESFAIQCGILTLDEPTTNLDRENVESLARALAELIASRKDNSNFQLILITHDEEFVDFLQRYAAADHFYQIKKNEHGHSTIRSVQF